MFSSHPRIFRSMIDGENRGLKLIISAFRSRYYIHVAMIGYKSNSFLNKDISCANYNSLRHGSLYSFVNIFSLIFIPKIINLLFCCTNEFIQINITCDKLLWIQIKLVILQLMLQRLIKSYSFA